MVTILSNFLHLHIQADMSIDGKFISYNEMVCEETYCFQEISIIIIIFDKKKPITQLYLQGQS